MDESRTVVLLASHMYKAKLVFVGCQRHCPSGGRREDEIAAQTKDKVEALQLVFIYNSEGSVEKACCVEKHPSSSTS